MSSLHHYRTERPDLLTAYLSNCTKVNDNHVENHNSRTQHCLPQNGLFTPAIVARAAQLSELKRDFIPEAEKELYMKSVSSSKGKGEIYHEETRHTRGKGLVDAPRVQTWSRCQIAMLSSLPPLLELGGAHSGSNPRESYIVRPEGWTGVDTFAASLKIGDKRVKEEVVPKYKEFLDKTKGKFNATNNVNIGGNSEKSEDFKYLSDAFTNAVLKAFLRWIGEKGFTSKGKDALINLVLQKASRYECNRFVVASGIKNAAEADAFYRNCNQVDTVIARQVALTASQEASEAHEDEMDEIENNSDPTHLDMDI
jgi:hypothetical protein